MGIAFSALSKHRSRLFHVLVFGSSPIFDPIRANSSLVYSVSQRIWPEKYIGADRPAPQPPSLTTQQDSLTWKYSRLSQKPSIPRKTSSTHSRVPSSYPKPSKPQQQSTLTHSPYPPTNYIKGTRPDILCYSSESHNCVGFLASGCDGVQLVHFVQPLTTYRFVKKVLMKMFINFSSSIFFSVRTRFFFLSSCSSFQFVRGLATTTYFTFFGLRYAG